MLLLTLRETYALNRLSSFKNLRAANLTTALGGQRSCYATACSQSYENYCFAQKFVQNSSPQRI